MSSLPSSALRALNRSNPVIKPFAIDAGQNPTSGNIIALSDAIDQQRLDEDALSRSLNQQLTLQSRRRLASSILNSRNSSLNPELVFWAEREGAPPPLPQKNLAGTRPPALPPKNIAGTMAPPLPQRGSLTYQAQVAAEKLKKSFRMTPTQSVVTLGLSTVITAGGVSLLLDENDGGTKRKGVFAVGIIMSAIGLIGVTLSIGGVLSSTRRRTRL